MARTINTHLDWLSATTSVAPAQIVARMRYVLDVGDVRVVMPHTRGYTTAVEVVDVNGDSICTIESGASHGRNLVISTGSQPNARVRDYLAETCDDALATRVDSAIDIEGDFDALAAIIESAAKSPRRGTAVKSFDYLVSPTGRTLYVGSPKSPLRLRLYEKSREQWAKGNTDFQPGIMRAEVQWRPSGDAHRRAAMTLSARQIWGASSWTADVASQLMDGVHVIDRPVTEATTWDRRYNWLRAQASRTFREAVSRYGLLPVLADLGIDDVQGAAIAAAPTV